LTVDLLGQQQSGSASTATTIQGHSRQVKYALAASQQALQ
jgi:microcompartment protein CcmL/EutN